ncbi:hypothetical protein [Flavobacterium sp. MDT1-60]|uniref:hypothetical protein n=1 Tax=Flavobacterium sp. MDT1-60 TaxID=1979344 RepID=UPI0017828FD4|nr:hypothetical protein [Flavobacterium sp. MDT1-60]QOG01417.1 hypothetical protein IHE43_16605 [Flavobacterium sp. MDT1-60]
MESKLSLSEFRTRLKNNTEIGSTTAHTEKVRIFPISGTIKPFYGSFDNTSFRLTVNSPKSSTPFIVKGNYKDVNNKVSVDYVIEANNKFQVIWTRYSPIILILVINIFFLFFARGLRRASTIVNLFLLFMAFYSRWNEERKRKKLEQKFISIFEIR